MLATSRGQTMSDHGAKRSRFMDLCAKLWLRAGSLFEARPATLIGVTVGAIIFACALTYVLVKQETTQHQLDSVTSAFCNGQNPDTAKCRKLLDALLRNPTPAQAAHLRQIVKEK